MTEGLDDQPIIKEYTNKYWRDNDVYVQYMMERITPALTPSGKPDEKVMISVSKIYNDFKMFMTENYPNTLIPDRKIVKDKLSEDDKLQKIHGNYWCGIRFKEHTVDMSHFKSFETEGPMGIRLPTVGVQEGSSRGNGAGLIGL